MTGSYDLLGVWTDLEPDDFLAIGIMKHAMRLAKTCVVVVGEGRRSKREMALGLLRALDIKADVVQGQPSSKDYPPLMHDLFDPIENASAEAERPTLFSLLRDSSNPLVVCMKPPRELMQLPIEVTSKITLICYGSFNFRALGALMPEWANMINTAFKEAIVYESFLVSGPQNSISAANSELFDLIERGAFANKPNSTFWLSLKIAARVWNKHIADDCLETIVTLATQMQEDLAQTNWEALRAKKLRLEDRNLKPLVDIIDNEGKQMVLADCALAAALCTNVNATVRRGQRLSFDANGYTQFTPDPAGKVGFFESRSFGIVVKWVVDACESQIGAF